MGQTKRLAGKTAVITGAGRGIGRAMALAFAREGAELALWSLSPGPIEDLALEIGSQGGKAIALAVDVSQKAAVVEAARLTRKALGKVDILINNAGQTRSTPIAEIDEQEWDLIFAGNAKSVFLCSQEFMAEMKQRGQGRIINLGSVGSKTGGLASGAHYCASKAAVTTFTFSLARELAPFGVCVNCIAPGPTDTEMLASVSQGDMERWKELVPLGRLASPDEVAGVALFLAGDEASYITGEVIDVNGGMLMD